MKEVKIIRTVPYAIAVEVDGYGRVESKNYEKLFEVNGELMIVIPFDYSHEPKQNLSNGVKAEIKRLEERISVATKRSNANHCYVDTDSGITTVKSEIKRLEDKIDLVIKSIGERFESNFLKEYNNFLNK